MKAKLLRLVIFIGIFLFFSLVFYFQNLKKGSFYGDEPWIVNMSRIRDRSVVSIFKDAAWMAQPPLEYTIREKLFTPLGRSLGLEGRFPEMYHRSFSLLWWLIPISYFAFYLKDFSTKNRLIILLAFVLIASSDFLGFYLTEVKHYSAIAAIFFSMVLIMLSDKEKIQKWGVRFLIISSIFPLLHIVSFLYYFSLLVLFLLYYYKSFKIKRNFYRSLFIIAVYLALIFAMYVAIQKISVSYQHPGLSNLRQIQYFDAHIKWTIDWVFSGTPFYIILKVIPKIMMDNLFPIFLAVGVPTAFYTIRKIWLSLSSKNPKLDVKIILPLIITLLWPTTIVTVFYQSGLFGGERYSIVLLVTTLFYTSALNVSLIYKLTSRKRYQLLAVLTLILFTGYLWTTHYIQYWRPKVATAENIFVRDNPAIINNPDNYIISDIGAYSLSVQLLGEILGSSLQANYLHCRHGIFQENEKSILNNWLDKHKKDNVYFLSSGQKLNSENEIVWQYQYLTLYRPKHIDQSLTCDDLDHLGNCYERCTKGQERSSDQRSFPHTTPFLDQKGL